MTDWPRVLAVVPACGVKVWLAEIMHAAIMVVHAIIDPLFAEGGPINTEAVPAYILVSACAAFLGVLTWAVKYCVKHGTEAIQHFYIHVVLPAVKAHIALMDAMRLTREQDSQSLKSLSQTQESILEKIIHNREHRDK